MRGRQSDFQPPLPHRHLSSNWARGDEAIRSQGRESPMLGHMPCVGGHGYVW